MWGIFSFTFLIADAVNAVEELYLVTEIQGGTS
jgi:hypothetical protein